MAATAAGKTTRKSPPSKEVAAKDAASAKFTPDPGAVQPTMPVRWPADRSEMERFYRDMLLIRRFEEKAGQL